ncbi:hypothetical protein [Microbulbifer sp. S227A]|uniref:hypothetical protein n=1 Tax=Microbulbifer sp. S227A TaxID=3415131 RepID=UPI003C7B3940
MATTHDFSVPRADEVIVSAQPVAYFPARPDGRDETCHCVFIDEIQVTDGVCQRQTLRGLEDLVTGDEYRFPDMHPDGRARVRIEGEDATIRLQASVEVGRAVVRARRTHRVTLMSDCAHVVQADLLETSTQRVMLALSGQVLAGGSYALIAIAASQVR